MNAGGNSYAYDDNGNMIFGAGRTLTWTSFNKPKTVVSTSTNTRFDYGPERARIRQVKVQGATTTTIKYVGTLFEQVGKTGAATRYVNYIFAGSKRVAIYTTDNAATPSPMLRYLHRDHLGSVDTVTNESGAVVERLSFDAFGKRRVASGANAWEDAAIAVVAASMKGAEARYARVVAAVALGGTASQLGGGKFANGAIAGAFGRLFNDEIHLQASLRIPRWLGRLVFGPDYIGQGGTVGGAVSFPGFTSGQFDLGVFVEGHGGGEDYGTGRFSVGIGYGKGDVRGLTGIGTEFSFNAKVGGLAVSLDRNDAFKGMGAHVGTGYNVGGTGTITRSWSVRSLKDWLSNRYGR